MYIIIILLWFLVIIKTTESDIIEWEKKTNSPFHVVFCFHLRKRTELPKRN